jgi:DNA-directed RNA polymerase subunit M/transcription elongation factor TFIIS
MGVRKTQEEFILNAQRVWGKNTYKYDLVNYVNDSTKVLIICTIPSHPPFPVSPNNFLKKIKPRGCPLCGKIKNHVSLRKTYEEFMKEAKEKFCKKYNYPSKNEFEKIYKNNNTIINIWCTTCKKYFPKRVGEHINPNKAGGCPDCGYKEGGLKNRLTLEEFIEKAQDIHKDVKGTPLYDYSKVKYEKSNIRVEIGCKKHQNYFSQRPDLHIYNKCGCPKCGIEKNVNKKIVSSKNTFFKLSPKIHKNKYDYSEVNYKGALTPVKIICPIHNEFWQIPILHQKGIGCPKCGIRKRADSQMKPFKKFELDAKKVHENAFGYFAKDWKGMNYHINIKCRECNHIFLRKPTDHLMGWGCPNCGKRKSISEIEITKYLKKHNISFKKQVRFENCKNSYPLPFDFYLQAHNICIEYQGIQHEKPFAFFGGLEGLLYRQENDEIKRNFCKKRNNPKLLEIWYDENIEEKLNKYLK